jgi:5-methylcytosine-specific restriction endonuclease McrA
VSWPAADPRRLSARERQLIRGALLRAFAYRCAECGEGGKLQVHHIDRDPGNNDPANLVPLCVPCHRKAEHGTIPW